MFKKLLKYGVYGLITCLAPSQVAAGTTSVFAPKQWVTDQLVMSNATDFVSSNQNSIAYKIVHATGGLGTNDVFEILAASNYVTQAAADARYAPTSTAVTVSSHTSQLSQLSQSVELKVDAQTVTGIAASASVTNAGAVAAAAADAAMNYLPITGGRMSGIIDMNDYGISIGDVLICEDYPGSIRFVSKIRPYPVSLLIPDEYPVATTKVVHGMATEISNAALAAATNYTDAATNATLAAANAYTDAKVSGGSRYPRLVWRGHTPYVEDIIDRGGDNISASLNLVRDVVLFTADEDNTRITIVSNTYDTVKSLPSVSLSYSRDYVMFPDVNASTWSPMSVSPESSDVITLQSGESVAIRCPTENTTLFGYCFSIISGSARVSGELMALASASVPDYFNSTNQFYSMFSHCANLSSAKGLNIAATNTLPYCMAGLFSHCFDLRYPPRELKPKIIAQRAYTSMFSWCTNLVEAPLIMAESAIGERAMWLMFYNCKHLESVSIRHLTSYTGSNSLRAFLSMENVSDDNRLNHVEVGFSSWTSQAAYFLETTAVTNGVFVCPSALGTQRATSSNSWRGAPVGWSIVNF